ncbi:MAG: hypothetical protein H7338_14755 [Candidatus Sericytochromatia bacterium]|nr:hypothetical protein [Candidatus Sericytochromatia bacterium]
MTRERWYTLQDASERYWIHRAKRADRTAGRSDSTYGIFEQARTGWRLLAFTFLAWEVLGRDPVNHTGNSFRLNGAYSEPWDVGGELVSEADLTTILDGPHVLGSLVLSQAGITDAGLRQVILATGAGADVPELGEGARLSHVGATATHFYNRNGSHHALILPDDGPPVMVDPQALVPELSRQVESAHAALQSAMGQARLDWVALERLTMAIREITEAIRRAVWAAHITADPEVQLAPSAQAPLLPAPSHEVILHLLSSISPLTTWEPDRDQAPQHVTAFSTLFVPVAGQVASPDGAWDLVSGLSDESLLVFLIAVSRWCQAAAGQPMLQPVPLSVQEILAMRGIAKHKHGGFKTVDKRRIVDQLQALNAIWVAMHAPWGEAGQTRSRLLDVVAAPSGNPYDFLVAPGSWVLAAGDSTRQLGYWFEALAKLDRRHEGLALRLGLYLCLQYRIRASYRNFEQPWRVSTLVSAAQPGTGEHHGELDRRNPKRLRWQLEGALDRLNELGVLESWEYAGDEPIDEGKGWFDGWMNGRMIIRPPAVLQQRYQAIAVSRKSAALPLRASRAKGSAGASA